MSHSEPPDDHDAADSSESQGGAGSSAPSFGGLRVGAFESRMAGEMARLIERHGGRPSVAPSMREIPLESSPEAIDFAHRLITGQIDLVVFMTGVGFRHLLDLVRRHVDERRYLDALSDVTTIARGPKVVAAMRDAGLTPTHRVPEPNTWREVLSLVDTLGTLAERDVGLQEYGKPNASLLAGLEARGARVRSIPIYRWELPEDLEPLRRNARRLAAGELDVLLFTSANQIHSLLDIAAEQGVLRPAKEALRRVVIGSVGPTTSETLRDLGIEVDLEADPPKMGVLVREAAANSESLRRRKLRRENLTVDALPRSTDASAVARPAWYDSPFLRACRREPTPHTPVWLMRQAGRYMAEYREVRAKTSFLELCKNPQLCSEVMCTAVARLGVDAAILFSDLLPILEPLGLELEFGAGEGPMIHNPVREPADVDRVRELESMDELQFVVDAVRQTRADLPEQLPLIGFAGAPFTLASYVIEGGGSRNYLHTKSLMYRDAGAWRTLMERLSRAVTLYLNAQIAAGAQAVQLFDSWAGCLGPDDYRRYVLPHVRDIIAGIEGAPVINFATGNPALLPLLAEAAPDVVGVDWRIRLDDAWRVVGHSQAVQGNLDPATLLAGRDELRRRVAEILKQADGRPGHIFNLGHGILPQTDVDQARALVDMVHELSARRG